MYTLSVSVTFQRENTEFLDSKLIIIANLDKIKWPFCSLKKKNSRKATVGTVSIN